MSHDPLDVLLIRCGVDKAEQRRWFSTCVLSFGTLYVADMDDFDTIVRCYDERLRAVLPSIVIQLRPQISVGENVSPRTPFVAASKQKQYDRDVKSGKIKPPPRTDMFGVK